MKRVYFISFMALICMSACQDRIIDADDSTRESIYPTAAIEGTPITRSPYESSEAADIADFSHPTPKNMLHTDVWGSTTEHVFEHKEVDGKPLDGSGSDGTVAIHTNASFSSGLPQLLRAAIYSETTKPEVYFVAFHPMSQNGSQWSTTDGSKASYTFDGNDDVMFAPQVQGKYAQDYSNSPNLQFRHLLTWLRVEMLADNLEVSESWGKIKSMSIRSKNTVTVDLSDDAYSNGSYISFEDLSLKDEATTHVKFSGESDLNFYTTTEEESYEGTQMTLKKNFTDDIFPGTSGADIPYRINTSTAYQEMAYVLCAPVYATAKTVVDEQDADSYEYLITIKTDKREVVVPVDLKESDSEPFTGNTRRTQFTIRLNFKMGNTVYVATSVSSWRSGGIVIGNLGD